MERARYLGAQLVAQLPHALRELVGEECHLAVAPLGVQPARAAGEALRVVPARRVERRALAEAVGDFARADLARFEAVAALELDRLEAGGLQVLEEQVLEVVLGLGGQHDLDALAAGDGLAVLQRHALVDVALEQGGPGDELEVLACDEDFAAARGHGFFEAEELAVAHVLGIERELARSAQHLGGRELALRQTLAVDQQLVLDVAVELAASLEVGVERQDRDRRVARVGPLRRATVLQEPGQRRVDERVLGVDRDQRAQHEGRRLDAAVGPARPDAVLAPVRRARRQRVLLSPAGHDRARLGRLVDDRAVGEVRHELACFARAAEALRGDCEERLRAGVERVLLLPELLEGLRDAHVVAGLARVRGQRLQHPGRQVALFLGLDQVQLQELDAALEHRLVDCDAAVAREREPPDDVGRHVLVAAAFLPPAPAAIGVLEVVQAREARLGDLLQFGQVLAALLRRAFLDAAEDAPKRILDREPALEHVLQLSRGIW